ncbi:MAG: hypothetical protein WBD09_02195 [Halobacteriota archaeon]
MDTGIARFPPLPPLPKEKRGGLIAEAFIKRKERTKEKRVGFRFSKGV